jgi:transcriptional regulator with XRE-family HTH domain
MHSDTSREIGINIRKWRIIKGNAQKDFAYLLGVAKSTLSKWENGYCKLNIIQLQKIAACLKLKITQLFTDPNDLLPPPHND